MTWWGVVSGLWGVSQPGGGAQPPYVTSLNDHSERQGLLGSWMVILRALLHTEVSIPGHGPLLFLHWLPFSCPLAVINVTPSGSALASSSGLLNWRVVLGTLEPTS